LDYTVTTPEDLLQLLLTHQYLTIKQIVKLLGKQSTVTNIREHINDWLIAQGLVEAETLPRKGRRGSSPYVYSLTRKGHKLFSEEDTQVGKKSVVALSHTLAINDVAILCQLVGKRNPVIQLFEQRFESVLKAHPIVLGEKGKGKDKEPLMIVPDFYSHLLLTAPYTTQKRTSVGMLWEIDRGTEDVYTMKEKIRRYQTLLLTDGLLESYFALSAVKIAFVVTPPAGISRLRQLLNWTRQVLQKSPDDSEFFYFTLCDPATIDPVDFFTQPLWYRATSATPLPLIEKKVAEPSTQFKQPFFKRSL
jgi:hypothetical protein